MTEFAEYRPNERTQNIVNLMLEIVDAAQATGRKIVVSCGLGLEIEAASRRGDDFLTRDHGDLDLHPSEEDILFWKEWFARKGYSITGNEEIKDPTKAFVAFPPKFSETDWDTNPDSFYADVYGIMVDGEGFIHSKETGEDDNWGKKWEEAFVDCQWKGRKITVLHHKHVLDNKRKTAKKMGTPLRPKDLHDYKLFGVNQED